MPQLVSDIGGTNVRFALVEQHQVVTDSIRVFSVSSFDSPGDALVQYLDAIGPQKFDRSVMAVATPIKGDFLDITNNHWAFSTSELANRFSIADLRFVNDFTALAHSLPELADDDLSIIGDHQLGAAGPKALMGPGTGFGVSGLIPLDGRWQALQGEGGHTTVAATSEREYALTSHLAGQFGHVSAERILSGPGLEWTYQALCALDGVDAGDLRAAQITASALSGSNPQCVETLETFFRQLGQCAGDLALTLGATGGLYIGGGIVPKLGDAIHNSCFRTSFESKGRMGAWLKTMPTALITAEFAALKGCAVLLAEP